MADQSPQGQAAAAGQTGNRIDPLRAFNFAIEFQGVTSGHFTRCAGLGVSVETIRYREAGSGGTVLCIPGQVTVSDIELSYGVTDSRELWDWMQQLIEGRVERRNLSIRMLDTNGIDERMRWNLFDALPKAWRAAELDAIAGEVAIESLILCCERIERG